MRGINKVIILGRMGHDPEEKKTAGGVTFVDLSVATNRSIQKGEEWIEVADWHQIRLWNLEAERSIKLLKKGSTAAFVGQLRTDNWLDQNGEKKTRTYIKGEHFEFVANSIAMITSNK